MYSSVYLSKDRVPALVDPCYAVATPLLRKGGWRTLGDNSVTQVIILPRRNCSVTLEC